MCCTADAVLQVQENIFVVLQGVRQPQAEASQDDVTQSPDRPDFTATLANFMAGGIDCCTA